MDINVVPAADGKHDVHKHFRSNGTWLRGWCMANHFSSTGAPTRSWARKPSFSCGIAWADSRWPTGISSRRMSRSSSQPATSTAAMISSTNVLCPTRTMPRLS
eukprot:2221722-Heterocapsa_arctica.AAC.1